MEQGTHSWLEERAKRVGSSDISIILGISPFKTVFELWQEKCGMILPEKLNEAMSRGSFFEPIVRGLYEEMYKNKFPPKVFIKGDFIGSSDGANEDLKRLLEIKVPSQKVIDAALNGEVVDYYRAQVQWLLMVSDYDHCDYVVYCHKNAVIAKVVRVGRDEEIMKEMAEKAAIFMDCVKNKKEPETDIWGRTKSWIVS